MATKRPATKPDRPTSLLDEMGNCVTAAKWLTEADRPTVKLGLRLAQLIDAILDSGEDLDKLAQLVAKFQWVLKELKLTPLSRERVTENVEEVDPSGKYADAYLRIVSTPNSDAKPKRKNPRTAS